jgi:hypothetical protein
MTYTELHNEIQTQEGQLAYGSETSIYGDFATAMAKIGGRDWRESDAQVPADESAWWSRCYDLYAADQQLPEDEQVTDLQDIYDRV